MAELYFDEQIETLPPELLRKLQDHRLRWQFRRCWDGSAWYRARFEAAGLSPETFGGLADLERLPLQTYGELSALGAADWVVPSVECIGSWRKSRRLARQHTTGDFTHIIDREARAYWAAGAQSHSYPLVRSLPVEQRRRWGPPVIDPERQVTVRSLRDSVVGVSLAYRCMGSVGRHWAADQLLPEVLDVETGASVPEGETGELVVTDLVREASPLIRYRTGLAVSFASEPCPCGRTSGRILHSKRFATP